MKEILDLGEAPTKGQYTKWVDEHDRLPTQDPMYNHDAGQPFQWSVDQPLVSSSLDPGMAQIMEQDWEAAQKNLRGQ